jgi:hypothetical protein
MEMKITLTDGRWMVNGKKITEMSDQERRFLNEFFEEIRNDIDSQLHKESLSI